ncbi:MAG: TerC/Alx family metal homeostasis membrane protein [Solirubrobacteraceae bacterium]|nr:TerC/Alx family metal homeostasis membrane protein [Solirubrobacteraceae bacterium]
MPSVPVAALGDDPGAIAIVIAVVGTLLLVDLLVFARGREPSLRESVVWSLGWLVVGLIATIPIALLSSSEEGINYVTVYLIERTLSLDNLVVFLLIFGSFAVPPAQRGILLFWGIVLALGMRGVAIVVGVELIDRFHVVIYILGATLLVLAWRMWQGGAEEVDPQRNPLVRLAGRVWPVGGYEGSHFWVRREGRAVLTPLALALAAIVAADIAFAIDSIPAAFAITDNALVIWAANGFALLGLRALFVLVTALVARFRYLNQTVAIVLGVVAVKLLVEDVYKVSATLSLALVVGLFAAGIGLSLIVERRETAAQVSPPSPPS